MKQSTNTKPAFRGWWKSGSPWVWLNAGAVTISMVMVLGLLLLIAVRGLLHFAAPTVYEMTVEQDDGSKAVMLGSIESVEDVTTARLRESGMIVDSELELVPRYLVKVGNRDSYGSDFRFVIEPRVIDRQVPEDVMIVERTEWGNQVGYLEAVRENGNVVAKGADAWPEFQQRIDRVVQLRDDIHAIERDEIGAINYEMEQLRLERRRLELEGRLTAEAELDLVARRTELDARYEALQQELTDLYSAINRDSYVARLADEREVEVPLARVVRAYQPNAMSVLRKTGFYFSKLWEFVSDEPREANTEGGVFPAIFGTVMMVLLMSIIVTPFGVIAAVYLKEYAKQGPLTRTIRIAVNNLAGVPSIVYGVFGLGFFVYFLGGNIDDLFYPEAQPSPTFGTPGLLWSSLTLALLTLPVVIVATEEGLSRIPRSIREGSFALGATRAETLWRTVIPMASPAMMTGLILAVARAAGEVAPLMLVGVVKLAPSLPVDGNAPFIHLERKFMHLGFHIYDVGFQSPNVEAARPLVFATAFLLVVIIVVLNLAAVAIRNRLREKYRALEH